MRPRCSASEGFIYPVAYIIIMGLRHLSILTYIQIPVEKYCYKRQLTNKELWPNRFVVDAYVFGWFIIELGFVAVCCWRYTFDGAFIQPTWVRYVMLVVAIYRLIDIFFAWLRVLVIPPLDAKSPRIILLTLLNYIETIVVFGVIGFLLHQWPYYRPIGEIQIADALRASFGILTPLGVSSLPEIWTTGLLFYFEYAFGLFFLIIIINIAVSHLTSKTS